MLIQKSVRCTFVCGFHSSIKMCIKKSKNYGLYSVDSRVLDTIQILLERDQTNFTLEDVMLDQSSASELVRRRRAIKDMLIAGLILKTKTVGKVDHHDLTDAGKLFFRFEKEISEWIGTENRASFSDFLKYLNEKKDYVSLVEFLSHTNYLEKLPFMKQAVLSAVTTSKQVGGHNGRRKYVHYAYAISHQGRSILELIENCHGIIETNMNRFYHEQQKKSNKDEVRAYPADIFRLVDYSNGHLGLLA